MFTRVFSELSMSDVDLAGGKGASLGEMTRAGIPVPPGFVVLASTFDHFLKEAHLEAEIDAVLDTVNTEAIHTVEDASEKIQALMLETKVPEVIGEEIKAAFQKLGVELVAVRSSATAEDGAAAAWAGQLETFLNTTEDQLLEHVKRCWASLFTPRAIFYRLEHDSTLPVQDTGSSVLRRDGLPTRSAAGPRPQQGGGPSHARLRELPSQKESRREISVAVAIQQMIQSDVSGVAFSVHPVTRDPNQLIIEAGWGLGEAVVSGAITPDSYVVDKEDWKLLETHVSEQERMMGRGGWEEVASARRMAQKLFEDEIVELSKLIVKLEDHYGFPVDVEWLRKDGVYSIMQSRPITTL